MDASDLSHDRHVFKPRTDIESLAERIRHRLPTQVVHPVERKV
jgi:hypothetical protein